MKFGMMFGDVARSLFRRPITRQYPFERQAAPTQLRGKLTYNPEGCTGCMLCVKDCTADALELITIDKANKRFVMRYHLDRCTYCAQCVQSCRFSCIQMSDDQWELAAINKEPFTVYYGNEADVESFVAKLTKPDAQEPVPA